MHKKKHIYQLHIIVIEMHLFILFLTNFIILWKGKYLSMDKTKNGKRKEKLLPRNREISGGKAHTNTWKLN